MRFCTTCGRNYDDEIGVCPRDGTPLFDVGAPEKEPLLAEASEPWAATSADNLKVPALQTTSEVSEELEDDIIDIDKENEGVLEEPETNSHEFESHSKEFPGPQDLDPSRELPVVDAEDEELPLDDALFDDEDAKEPVSSNAIADGIDDLLGDDHEDDNPPTLSIDPGEDEPLLEDELTPIQPKKSGGGLLIPLLFLLIVGGLAAFYFVGGGKEMLSPKKAEPVKMTVEAPKKAKKAIPVPVKEVVKEEPPKKIDEKTDTPESEQNTQKKEDTLPEKNLKKATESKKIEQNKKSNTVAKPVKKKKVAKKTKPAKSPTKPVKTKTAAKKKKISKKKKPVEDPEELLKKELERMNGE